MGGRQRQGRKAHATAQMRSQRCMLVAIPRSGVDSHMLSTGELFHLLLFLEIVYPRIYLTKGQWVVYQYRIRITKLMIGKNFGLCTRAKMNMYRTIPQNNWLKSETPVNHFIENKPSDDPRAVKFRLPKSFLHEEWSKVNEEGVYS